MRTDEAVLNRTQIRLHPDLYGALDAPAMVAVGVLGRDVWVFRARVHRVWSHHGAVVVPAWHRVELRRGRFPAALGQIPAVGPGIVIRGAASVPSRSLAMLT